jgi:fused signal recognition particle receptor
LPAGGLETGDDLRAALRKSIADTLNERGGDATLRLPVDPSEGPAVIMVVGVNGGGKTTTLGKLAHRFTSEGVKVGRMNRFSFCLIR